MELRKNEETGAVEKQVVTYETVERDGLQSVVTEKETALEAVRNAGTELAAQVEANNADTARLESELNEAKSGLDQYDSVAGVQQPDVQPEPAATDTPVETTDSSEAIDIPIQF